MVVRLPLSSSDTLQNHTTVCVPFVSGNLLAAARSCSHGRKGAFAWVAWRQRTGLRPLELILLKKPRANLETGIEHIQTGPPILANTVNSQGIL